jgi:hypothetical protein
MEHLSFLLINYIILILIIYIDRKEWKDYLFVSLLGLALAFFFENMTTYWGFWVYNSEPKVVFISLYTWLLYAPYLSFCRFFVRRVER